MSELQTIEPAKAITPVQQDIKPFNPEEDVLRATKAANVLMQIMNNKPKKVVMNGEQYLEFEDWQTIGQFFSHTTGTEWTKPITQEGKIVGYEAKANLYNKDGAIIGGAEAACMRDEKNWAEKPDFQLRSMAQTRAMAKALRSRFGFVAVLGGFKPTPVEELDGMVTSEPQGFSKTAINKSGSAQPSDKQLGLIKKLMEQKGYTEADLIDGGLTDLRSLTGGKDGSASELIGWLMTAPTRITPAGDPVIDKEAQLYM